MNNTQHTVIGQIRTSLKRANRMALVIGAVLGGLVPAMTYTLAHHYVQATPALWLLVAGGLLFSALTVYQWGRVAFGSAWKSAGFVLLLEGVLTFTDAKLAGTSLAALVFVNATATACRLAVESAAPARKARTKRQSPTQLRAVA